MYSRFIFHSINEVKEDNALDWIGQTLKSGGLFFLEARSIHDPMFGEGDNLSETENFTDHYRRYMEFDKFCDKLTKRNFKIIYSVESNGLAVYGGDDPVVIRIIAEKI